MRKLLVALAFGAVSAGHAAETVTWKNLKMGGGGFVTGVIASSKVKNLFYARTDVGGAYRWRESDKTWIPMLDFITNGNHQGVGSIALDSTNPARVWLTTGNYGSGDSLRRSDDTGKTWVSVSKMPIQLGGNGTGRHMGERLSVDPKNPNILLYGNNVSGLLRSLDGGLTWTVAAAAKKGVSFTIFDPTSGTVTVGGQARTKRIFVGIVDTLSTSARANGVLLSNDGGQTWSTLAGGPGAFAYYPYRAALTRGGKLYVTYGGNFSGGGTGKVWLWKTPGSANGVDITPSFAAATYNAISVIPGTENVLFGTINKNWGSYAYANDATAKTRYGNELVFSFNYTLYAANPTAPQKAISTPFKRSVMSTDDPGVWQYNNHWMSSLAIDPFNPKRAFTGGGCGIFRTENALDTARNWTFSVRGIEEVVPMGTAVSSTGRIGSTMWDYSFFSNANVNSYATVYSGTGRNIDVEVARKNAALWVRSGGNWRAFHISWDSTKTWKPVVRPVESREGRLALSPSGRFLYYAANDVATSTQFIYKADLAGKLVTGIDTIRPTWVKSNLDLGTAGSLVADPAVEGNVYGLLAGNFYRSVDTGKSFQKLSKIENGITLAADDATRPISRIAPFPTGNKFLAVIRYAIPWYNVKEMVYLATITDKGLELSPRTSVFSKGAGAISVGAPAPGNLHPTLWVYGNPPDKEVMSYWKSVDTGHTWIQVPNAQNKYGGLMNGGYIVADPYVYGRVFQSTGGRGVAFFETTNPAGVATVSMGSATTTTGTDLLLYSQSIGLTEMKSCTFKVNGTSIQATFNPWNRGGTWEARLPKAAGIYTAYATFNGDDSLRSAPVLKDIGGVVSIPLKLVGTWSGKGTIQYTLPATFKSTQTVKITSTRIGGSSYSFVDGNAHAGVNVRLLYNSLRYPAGQYLISIEVDGKLVGQMRTTKL